MMKNELEIKNLKAKYKNKIFEIYEKKTNFDPYRTIDPLKYGEHECNQRMKDFKMLQEIVFYQEYLIQVENITTFLNLPPAFKTLTFNKGNQPITLLTLCQKQIEQICKIDVLPYQTLTCKLSKFGLKPNGEKIKQLILDYEQIEKQNETVEICAINTNQINESFNESFSTTISKPTCTIL